MKYTSKLLATLLTALMLIGVFPVFAGPPPNVPHNGNAVWMEKTFIPHTGLDYANFTTDEVTVGSKFNVTVFVNFTQDVSTNLIGAFQTVIVYRNDTLNFTRYGWTEKVTDPSSPSYGQAISQWRKNCGGWKVTRAFSKGGWDANHEYVLPGESWAAPDIGEPANPKMYKGSNGTLVWIEFEILKLPGKGLEINELLEFGFGATIKCKMLDDAGADVSGSFNWYNFPVNIKWSMPSVLPYMAVTPTSRTYGPFPPSVVGTTFTEDIYIKELSGAWGIVNASFKLSFVTTFLGVLSVALDITNWNVAATADYTTTPGVIDFYVETNKALAGDVHVATVTFNITAQNTYPGSDFVSPLTFSDVVLKDHTLLIGTRAPLNGTITVLALMTLPLPYLEVKFVDTGTNEIVLGPEPVIGDTFKAEVWIKNLHFAWYLIGIQYRLTYCPSLLQVVSVIEGPYLPSHNQTNVPPPTWFSAILLPDGTYGPHVLVGELILPNGTGQWPAPLPGADPPEDGLIATITYKVLDQQCDRNLTCSLQFKQTKLIDVNGKKIPTTAPVNGTVKVLTISMYWPGRLIDVYGGAVNRGYGVPYSHDTPSAFPAPYGGQGPEGNMDLVIPQSVVYLLADVTYNYWPVQSKDVGFEIEGPYEQEGWNKTSPVPRRSWYVRKYAARTNETGTAWIKFQMPWPCENPEDLFGKYKVTVTVDICGVVVNDTLWFDYYYLVEITKVTTNKYCYWHCEDVEITIEFRSKAQQRYPLLLAVVIQDELETHFGYAYVETYVAGAEFCHWKEYTETVAIHVVKWAFAGVAKIFVSAFDMDPTVGGAPWCPTYGLGWPLDPQTGEPVPLPEIGIMPYSY
jgi:hypothetical protein